MSTDRFEKAKLALIEDLNRLIIAVSTDTILEIEMKKMEMAINKFRYEMALKAYSSVPIDQKDFVK